MGGGEGAFGGPGGVGVTSVWAGPGVYTVTFRVGGPGGYYQQWSDYGPWKENFGKWMDNFGGWMDRYMGGMGKWMDNFMGGMGNWMDGMGDWMDDMGDWMGGMGDWMGGMGSWMGRSINGRFPFGRPIRRPGGYRPYGGSNQGPSGVPNIGGGRGVEIFTSGPNNDNNPYPGYLP